MTRNLLFVIFLCALAGCGADETTNSQFTSPAPEGAHLPFLTSLNDHLYLSWVQQLEDTSVLSYAKYDGAKWTPPVEISRGTNWFVNWADYPMISAYGAGEMIAHFPAKSSDGTYSYDVHMTQSDDGLSWGPDFIPHSDSTPTEHGFVTMMPYENKMLAAWLDGRNTGATDDHSATGHAAMTIRSAVIGQNGELTNEFELDDRVCDCCQTDGAVTENGPVVVYRDRSKEEVRDMSIVRFVDGEWTPPQTVYPDNWKIAGCPVNGPRVAAVNNTVAMAWFTAPNNKAEVKLIFSKDGGATFDHPVMIDDSGPVGRVDVVMVDDATAVISWVDMGESMAEIKAAVVTVEGHINQTFKVGTMKPSRESGFPQMEIINYELYFAWTSILENSTNVVITKHELEI